MSGVFNQEEQAILDSLGIDSTGADIEQPDGAGAADEAQGDAAKPAESPNPAPEQPTAPVQDATAQPAGEAKPATTDQPAAPQGDQRAALRAARRSERRLRDEVEALRRENEQLKGKSDAVTTEITDDELAQMEVDFPLQAKLVRQQRELKAQLEQVTAAKAPPPEFEPIAYDPVVQAEIDKVPDLLAWQEDADAQDKFLRAIEYDKALALDPDWRERTVSERFAEAARRTKNAFAQTTTPEPAATTAAPRRDPAAAIQSAPVQGPKGISDFRGGAPLQSSRPDYSEMSNEEIMASLKPE
jgi:hypothetical protein